MKAVLALRGETQGHLAARLQIDQALLSRILTGRVHRPALWQAIWNALTTESRHEESR